MARLSISSLLISATILTPIYSTLAEEANPGTCSIMTVVSDTGEITWSTDEAAAELISIAKDTNLSPEEAHSACHGEDAVQQAESEETAEEEKVEDVAAAEDAADEAGEESLMSSVGALAPLAGLGLVGGGGGGSSSSSTFLDSGTSSYTYNSSLDDTWRARQEYKNVNIYRTVNYPSYAHPYTLLGVDDAYAYGLSGAGETIAILDNGYSSGHDEVSGKTISTYGTIGVGSHGQHVIGLAAANYDSNNSTFNSSWSGTYGNLTYGMHGVAYGANLHIADYDSTWSPTHWAAATDSAKSSAAVVQNNSWGFDDNLNINTVYNYMNNNSLSAAATLVAYQSTDSDGDGYYDVGYTTSQQSWSTSDWNTYVSSLNSFQEVGVVVVALSNDSSMSDADTMAGMPVLFPSLAEAWLTVGNAKVTGSSISSSTVSRQSAPCGSTAQYCLFADGYYLVSMDDDSTADYASRTGSSMAAPQVSGLIALLAQAFPNHTPEQLVDRLLASADNSFFTASGSTSFANGVTHGYSTTYGHGIPDIYAALQAITSSRAILVGQNIGSASRFEIDDTNIRLGGAFGDAIDQALRGRKAYFYDALNGGFAFDLGALVHAKPSTSSSAHSFNSFGGSTILERRQADNGMAFISSSKGTKQPMDSLMAFIPVSQTSVGFVAQDVNLQNGLAFSQRSGSSPFMIDQSSPFKIPFLEASENGSSLGSRNKIGNADFSFGLFDGASSTYGLDTHGFVAEYGAELGSSYSSAFIGVSNEADGFLQTSINGAFAESSEANTTFLGVSSFGWLDKTWSYNAIGSWGLTSMKTGGLGLLNDVSDVSSSSFAFEVARPVGLSDEDSIHIGVSQPLRVESGNASLKVPGLYKEGGELQYTNAEIGLSPSGRQIDFSVGYQAKLKQKFNVGVRLAISDDVGHVRSNSVENSAMAFLKFAL